MKAEADRFEIIQRPENATRLFWPRPAILLGAVLILGATLLVLIEYLLYFRPSVRGGALPS